ncbi:hypothetical protein [Streptomyces sp. V1I1]|uniref:hypothetical protein n=1 Tax=Streptomyces sp. V1I1 TaxID=3042272 RepID=UPI00278A7DBC|nr:hypothetical protein [Streptomyces sp. V1I1]MDQ0938781.1 hypothetical protein [Streptomyces sp. V1I1]
MPYARTLRTCCAVLAGGLIWSGCSSEPEPAAKRASPTTTAQQKPSPTATPSPTGMDFTPGPERAPKTAADGVRLARTVAAGPEHFGPGFVRRAPYESDPAVWAVLDGDCLWQQSPLPSGVLASLTRHSELPAQGGKGPLSVSAVVTVHRDVRGADWELARTLEEVLRCPQQQLSRSEKITGLLSQGTVFGAGGNRYADDALGELGEYYSDDLGGPHPYYWDQARIGQVTVAVVSKGSKGRTKEELDAATSAAVSSMLIRLQKELEAAQ